MSSPPWLPVRLFAAGVRIMAFSREGDVWVWEDEVPRGRLTGLDEPELGALQGDSFAAAEGDRVVAWSLTSMQPLAGFEAAAPVRGLGYVRPGTLRIVDAAGGVTDLALDGAAPSETTSLGGPVDAALVSAMGVVVARSGTLHWSSRETPLTTDEPILGKLVQRGHARPLGSLVADSDGLRVTVAGRRVTVQRDEKPHQMFPLFSPVSDVVVSAGRAYIRSREGDVFVASEHSDEFLRLPPVPPAPSTPIEWQRLGPREEPPEPETERPLSAARPLLEAVARHFRSSGGYREAPARAQLHRSGVELQLEIADETARVTITHDGRGFRVEVATSRPAPIPTRPMIRLARILRRREQSTEDLAFARDLTGTSKASLDRAGDALSLLIACARLPPASTLISWIQAVIHRARPSRSP